MQPRSFGSRIFRQSSVSPSNRIEHALLGAGVAVVRVEGIADEAAVAGHVRFPAAEQADLALELDGRRRHQRDVQPGRGIAERQPGREIVAPVQDQVVAADQLFNIVAVEPVLHRNGIDPRIESACKIGGEQGFQVAELVVAEDRLALEVRTLDLAVVDDRQPSDTGAGKRRDRGAADPTGADHCDLRRLQPPLPDSADLRQDDMPGVAVEFVAAELGHRPVEPKPPEPRCVSPSSPTSTKSARSTGAGTSCAMRSPRRTPNGSWPRLIRITLTSPR